MGEGFGGGDLGGGVDDCGWEAGVSSHACDGDRNGSTAPKRCLLSSGHRRGLIQYFTKFARQICEHVSTARVTAS